MPPQDQNMNQVPAPAPSSPRQSVGPLIGAVIVFALLVLGGLYFWGARLNQEGMQNQLPYIPGDETGEGATQDDATLNAQAEMELNQALPQQSTSDDVDSIEDDFGAMDINAVTTQTSGDASTFGEEAQ